MIYWLTDSKGEKKGKKKVAERSKFDHIFSINLYTTVSRLSKLLLSETFWKKNCLSNRQANIRKKYFPNHGPRSKWQKLVKVINENSYM